MRCGSHRRSSAIEPGTALAPPTATTTAIMMARRSTTRRGYGWQHQRLRAYWRPLVQAGQVACARCGQPIRPDQAWHLGHDDHDRRIYTGPEHAACNLAAAGRIGRSRQLSPKPKRVTKW
jgi:hypothetical protein